MAIVFLRRRHLGAGSTRNMAALIVQLGGVARVVRSWVPEELASIQHDDLVVRWGCTATIPGDPAVLNSAAAIHWCADKRAGRLAMQDAGVPVPETFTSEDFVTRLHRQGTFVLRPPQHAQGRNLWTGDYDWMRANCMRLAPTGYVSRLIAKVAEYRVFCIQNRVAWVARKTPGNPDQVAWNVAQGGRFDNVRWDDWPTLVVDAALKAARVSQADFCGVDVMVDAEGRPYVLEANSAPSQTSEYRQRCVAKALLRIATAGDKAPLPAVEWSPRKTYKSYIHPGVRESRE